MALKLLKYETAQKGLKEIVDSAYSMKQNLSARVKTPFLADGTDLWDTWLDSKTFNLCGGVNQDDRYRFKIDHDFDLSRIISAKINSDGSISTDENIYNKSKGTEFIIISRRDVEGAEADYAIRADKYKNIQEQLNKGEYRINELKKAGAGGFKINEWLKPDKIPTHDGWIELAVGKNNASKKDYENASKFLKDKYVPLAEKRGCFSDGTGMGFFVRTDVKDCNVRPWYVDDSNDGSDADFRNDFDYFGRFLGVCSKKSAEGAREKKKVSKLPYTNKDVDSKINILEEVINGKIGTLKLYKVKDFLQKIKKY